MGGTPALPPRLVETAERTGSGLPLETVFPVIAGKNNVRWWSFDWKWVDFYPTHGGAPVRLYFYEGERKIAQLTKAFTTDAYREYAESFGYRPTKRIPYLVYNSHFEFESTNAFFVNEYILGVTSTVDLTMALPYWGEHRRFRHVMRHELAHQFTIQLVRDRAAKAGCDPLQRYPLWFIEGIAQFFALHGKLAPEARMALGDRLLDRPDSRRGGLQSFFDDFPLNFERVYLIGHAQAVFLEELGGAGTIRRMLEAAPSLCDSDGSKSGEVPVAGFADLVSRQLKMPSDKVQERWRQWVLARTANQIIAKHPFAFFSRVTGLADGDVDSYTLSPDRRTIFYRIMDRQTGRGRLYIQDLGVPETRKLVAEDQVPGLISFHAGGRRVIAIGGEYLAYVGRVDVSDVLFVRRYKRNQQNQRVTYELEKPLKHNFWKSHRMIEMGYPAINPRDGSLTFVGLSHQSELLDIYGLSLPLERGSPLERLSDDPYAERDLVYDPQGILYYVSDATPDGNYEIFRRDGKGPGTPVTMFGGDAEITDPAPGFDGGLLFSAAFVDVPQIHRLDLKDGAVKTLTDIPTAASAPALDAAGHLVMMTIEAGRPYMVKLMRERWLDEELPPDVTAAGPTADAGAADGQPTRGPRPAPAPWPLPLGTPQAYIDGAREYQPYDPRNYRFQEGILFGGTGPFLLGAAVITDVLKDHVLGARVEVLGDWEFTNAGLFFIDRSGRFGLGAGAFMRTGLNLIPNGDPLFFDGFLLQRIGGSFIFEYPFGYYSRFEALVSPQMLRTFDFSNSIARNEADTGGFKPAIEVGGRFGVDTLRYVPPVGPSDGMSFLLDVSATQRFADDRPFGRAAIELSAYQALSASERVYLFGRLGGGSGFGGIFAEQFYLPSIFNLRAYPQTSSLLFGKHYYVANAELRIPLDFLLPFLSYVEGVGGFDFGGIFFDFDRAWDARVAAGVLGFNFGLGPLGLRLHFARPIDVGRGVPEDEWLTQFSLLTPFLFF